MGRKYTLKCASPFHPIPHSSQVSNIDMDVENQSVIIVESYMKEAPSIHANGESSSKNGSQPVSLGRTRSQRAKAQDIDGSLSSKPPSSKQQQIDVSQTGSKTPLSGHANGESSSVNGSLAKSNGSRATSLRRTCSESAKEREIDGSPILSNENSIFLKLIRGLQKRGRFLNLVFIRKNMPNFLQR
nr:uncharacterized protein LOC117279981 isoform X2 [Nicotiana tomentosiformis]